MSCVVCMRVLCAPCAHLGTDAIEKIFRARISGRSPKQHRETNILFFAFIFILVTAALTTRRK